MSSLSNPLIGSAIDEYVRQVIDVALPAAADQAALAAAIKAWDESNPVQQERFRQLADNVMRVAGRNVDVGQVNTLAVTTPGTGYKVNDKITITTSTGVGAAGRVATIGTAGEILSVGLTIAGQGYLAADTATVITSTAGTGGVVVATVAKNEKKMLLDAIITLLA